jgi:hypothetical protein
VHAGLHVPCKMAHIHTQGARGALPRGCVGALLRDAREGAPQEYPKRGRK